MPGTIQQAHVAEITPEIIAQEALTVLAAELHLARNVTKEAELVSADQITPVKKGKVISVPKLGTVEAHEKAAGGDVVLNQADMTDVQITVDNHWECTIAPEDAAQAVVDRNIQDTYLGDMIRVLAEKIETKLAAEFANFTNTPIDATGATKDTIESFVLQARKKLRDNRAPMTGLFGYWGTGATNILLESPRFTEVAKYGSGISIQEGEMGKIHGFRSFESLFTPGDGGSPEVYSNALMHRRALVLAMRPLPTPRGGGVKASVVVDPNSGLAMRVLYSYNAQKLADQLTLDVLFGVHTLRPELGVVVQTN